MQGAKLLFLSFPQVQIAFPEPQLQALTLPAPFVLLKGTGLNYTQHPCIREPSSWLQQGKGHFSPSLELAAFKHCCLPRA